MNHQQLKGPNLSPIACSMKATGSRLLIIPVVLALAVSLGMDRREKLGYSILNEIAYRAYDGDAVAMRRLVSAARSSNRDVARRARWLLSVSLNPDNVSTIAKIYNSSDDEAVRTEIQGSLSLLRTKTLGRVVLRALAQQEGEIVTHAEELLAEPHKEAPTDEETRQILLNESPEDAARRDSLFAEFEGAETLPERTEILRELWLLGDERLVPYVEDLLAQMETEPKRSYFSGWKFMIYSIVERASQKKGADLAVNEKEEIYSKILSALVEEKSSLLDVQDQPVKLTYPRIGGRALRDHVIYVEDTDVDGIQDLAAEGYTIYVLPIWKIMSLANKKSWALGHLRFGRIYAYLDYAVLWVSYAPTTCIRHPDCGTSGSGSELLLKKQDGEWRFRSVLSSFVI